MQPAFASVSPPSLMEPPPIPHAGKLLLARIDAEPDKEKKMELILAGRRLFPTVWDTAPTETADFIVDLYKRARAIDAQDNNRRYQIIANAVKLIRHIAEQNKSAAVALVSQMYDARDSGMIHKYMETMRLELAGKRRPHDKVANPDALLAEYDLA